MDVRDMLTYGLLIAITGIVLSFSALITVEVGAETCPSGSTYGYYSTSGSQNPATETYDGCCSSINASAATDCDTWTSNEAFNITNSAVTGLGTFGDWLPTIVLAVLFGIVIGVVIKAVAGAGRGRI